MRGEDGPTYTQVVEHIGSPPHARGRPCSYDVPFYRLGITPACAGKTILAWGCLGLNRDHPRMRGEDCSVFRWPTRIRGSPPHARGRRFQEVYYVVPRGITPACAGKTFFPLFVGTAGTDHPRMRGEDAFPGRGTMPRNGSPPHARGRHVAVRAEWKENRITPACAGKTPRQRREGYASPDHPRMRGEDAAELRFVGVRLRITPACAGKTSSNCAQRT